MLCITIVCNYILSMRSVNLIALKQVHYTCHLACGWSRSKGSIIHIFLSCHSKRLHLDDGIKEDDQRSYWKIHIPETSLESLLFYDKTEIVEVD
jgi:hypothetical protein